MIAIIDYGMGNLRSVQKALELLGYDAVVTQSPQKIKDAAKVILPGVGAFGAAMTNLENMGLLEPTIEAAKSGKPFLGICLGMQLLLEKSEEQGDYKGLGLVKGEVLKFFKPQDHNAATDKLKVPHMGWNSLSVKDDCTFLAGVPEGAMVYFVHSYYVDPTEPVAAASTDYGIDFCSVIHKDNIVATQFHPEKSGAVGLRMLRNFAEGS